MIKLAHNTFSFGSNSSEKNTSFNVKLFWIITTCCIDWEARHSSPVWGSGDFTFDLKTIFSRPFVAIPLHLFIYWWLINNAISKVVYVVVDLKLVLQVYKWQLTGWQWQQYFLKMTLTMTNDRRGIGHECNYYDNDDNHVLLLDIDNVMLCQTILTISSQAIMMAT